MIMSTSDANMDDLVSSLALDFSLGSNPGMNADTPHPHFALYKNRGRALDQEARRKKELELQKKKRFDAFMHARRLADDNWVGYDVGQMEDEEEEGTDVSKPEMMDTDHSTRAKNHKISYHNNEKYYKKQLMLAEWFLRKPPDFENCFLLKMCPMGRHVLVVAAKGNTRIYNKGGRLLKTFRSQLPGGGLKSSRKEYSYLTLLDCIYSLDQELLYVLDVMAWRQNVFYDEPTAQRFDWLSSYYKCELEEAPEGNSVTQIRFSVLPAFDCATDNLQQVFSSPAPFQVDGLLFYHGDAHYHFGSTTLVTWLKPYMVSEQLECSEIDASFLRDMPSDYVNYLTDIQKYEETRRQLRHCIGEQKSACANNDISRAADNGPMPRQRHNTMDSSQRSSAILNVQTTSPVHGRQEANMMDE